MTADACTIFLPLGIKSPGKENLMATVNTPLSIPPEEMADMEEVCRLIAEGKRVNDPELLKRIRERSEEVQRQIREKYGMVEWAVDLIRQVREEE